jgi:hypothetical protein
MLTRGQEHVSLRWSDTGRSSTPPRTSLGQSSKPLTGVLSRSTSRSCALRSWFPCLPSRTLSTRCNQSGLRCPRTSLGHGSQGVGSPGRGWTHQQTKSQAQACLRMVLVIGRWSWRRLRSRLIEVLLSFHEATEDQVGMLHQDWVPRSPHSRVRQQRRRFEKRSNDR